MEDKSKVIVSIIVPIFNIEDYLVKCIDSIRNQTYPKLEIILVDDGSTDHCPIICDEYAQKDCRIKVIHKENGGVVSARKTGAAAAQGDYITTVDGDDWIEEERIEHLVEKGISAGADMIYMAGIYKEYPHRSNLIQSEIALKTYYGREILEEVFPMIQNTKYCFEHKLRGNQCMWAIKRPLLQEKQLLVDDRIRKAEDQTCIWFCLLEAKSVTIIEECGYHYIQHDKSACHTITERDYNNLKIWYYQLRDYVEEHCREPIVKKILTFQTIATLMYMDYSIFWKTNLDYLYPFPKVKRGSKLIVYGAGDFGGRFVRALDASPDYQLVVWVDRRGQNQIAALHIVEPLEKILNVSYDFIVIAIMDRRVSENVRHSLVQMGIPEEKIAQMDSRVIREECLPEDFR